MTGELRKTGSRPARAAARAWARVRRSEAGEGVISAAIAVLIMAFLGAAMWLAFSNTMTHAQHNVDNQVGSIGTSAGLGGTPTTAGIGGTPTP